MKKRNLVFSTDQSQMCAKCNNHIQGCQCKSADNILGNGDVKLLLETKGRKGKGVSIITGLAMTEKELKELAKALKALCGTGGSVKAGNIEIQGDNRDKIAIFLAKKDIKAKKSGS